jgi:hypothetical protein
MRKKVLITVTTYPLPSRSYDELVCTAGVLEDGTWIRIYPVPFKFLSGLRADGKLSSYKYTWIELDLRKRADDFRPESHSPVHYDFSDVTIYDRIETKGNGWDERKHFCMANVHTNMNALIAASQAPTNVSLATFKPTEFISFEVEDDEREWKQEWKDQIRQLDMFYTPAQGGSSTRQMIKKLPYKFYYKFKDDAGTTRRLMIEDWEIGQLYFNCLRLYGSEEEALSKVKQKYWDEFMSKNDVHLFLGTTRQWHTRRSNNPFVIIGVFYPPKVALKPVGKSVDQLRLF